MFELRKRCYRSVALIIILVCWVLTANAQQELPLEKLKTLAEGGDVNAQFALGVRYYNGNGVPKDFDEAVKWYKKVAYSGNVQAQIMMGLCYEKGHGVEKDYTQACSWYRKAADQGDSNAQLLFGSYLNRQKRGRIDEQEAVELFRKSAQQGNPNAQLLLSKCYFLGEGTDKDFVESYAYLNLAAVTNQTAKKMRESLEKMLSSDEIAEAQKRTKQLQSEIVIPLPKK